MGRRPGTATSRGAILDAARRRFAAAGYEATSLRAIAADARVDPAVVLHFFGSKDGLFRAVVGWPFDPAAVGARIAAAAPDDLGAQLARIFLGFWEDPTTRPALLAVLRSGMTHEPSAAILRDFVVRQAFSTVAGRIGGRIVYATPGTALHQQWLTRHTAGERLVLGPQHPMAKMAFMGSRLGIA